MKSRQEEEQAKVDAWNQNCPQGTSVIRYEFMNPRRGPKPQTKTRSAAWLLGGHTAVAQVIGVAGCLALDCLEVVKRG